MNNITLTVKYLGRLKFSPDGGISAGFLNTVAESSLVGICSSGCCCCSSVLIVPSTSFSAAKTKKRFDLSIQYNVLKQQMLSKKLIFNSF